MSFPQSALISPEEVVSTFGVRNVRAFLLAFLPSGPAQVPVLANNGTVQGWKDRPPYNGMLFFPVPKRQGGHVHVIVHLQPLFPPYG